MARLTPMHAMRWLGKSPRIGLAFLLSSAFFFALFVPLQEQMGLNLVSVAEPYIRTELYFHVFSIANTVAGRFFFMPLVIWTGGRWMHGLLGRIFGTPQATGLSRAWRTRPRKRCVWRPIKIAYVSVCVAGLFIQTVFFLRFLAVAGAHPIGVRGYLHHCGRCHAYTRGMNFNLTSGEWDLNLQRMSLYAGWKHSPIPFSTSRAIFGLMNATRGYSDRRLLWSKCYSCHWPPRVFSRRRTAAEWAHIVQRVQREDQFFITERQAGQIKIYLAANNRWTMPDPPTGSQGFGVWKDTLTFENRCGICHTLDIILTQHVHEGDWPQTLKRMVAKAPEVLAEEEVLSMAEMIRALRTQKDDLPHRFPHSRSREKDFD